jgi:hypothetical protein
MGKSTDTVSQFMNTVEEVLQIKEIDPTLILPSSNAHLYKLKM